MATLLIVDDETALIRVLREAFELKLPGVMLRSASNWDEAMEQAQSGHIDVLITDQHLGGHSGTELCEALKDRFPALKMLIYTGKASPAVEAAAAAIGARVLWKPMRLGALIQEVERELPTG